jgi:hypothetical protein
MNSVRFRLSEFFKTIFNKRPQTPVYNRPIRGCIQNFPDWVDNEVNNTNKHSLGSNTKGYGGKTH